jgi:hypothetical protein
LLRHGPNTNINLNFNIKTVPRPLRQQFDFGRGGGGWVINGESTLLSLARLKHCGALHQRAHLPWRFWQRRQRVANSSIACVQILNACCSDFAAQCSILSEAVISAMYILYMYVAHAIICDMPHCLRANLCLRCTFITGLQWHDGEGKAIANPARDRIELWEIKVTTNLTVSIR